MIESFNQGVERRLATLSSFGLSVTLYAETVNTSWPFVTIPEFELQSLAARILAGGAQTLALLPIVNDSLRSQWESFSLANQQWRQNDWNLSSDSSFGESPSISSYIYQLSANGTAVNDTGPGPYLPIWQSSPVALANHVNLNLLSDPTLNATAHSMLEFQTAILSDLIDPTASPNAFPFHSPYSIILYPVFRRTGQNDQLVAALAMEIIWEDFLTSLMPAQSTGGMVIVLEDTIGQTHSYLVNGADVELLGKGDLHDETFDRLEEEYDIVAVLPQQASNGTLVNTDANTYRIRIYPTVGLQNELKTNRPITLVVIVNLMFLFWVMVFLVYYRLVERWRSKLLQNAMRSTEIVSSLFPSTVRDRILNSHQVTPQPSVILANGKSVHAIQKVTRFVHEGHVWPGDTPKLMIQSFLSNVPAFGYDPDEEFHNCKPIADLFPHTTVMFADICGFTAWSSAREPSQVFLLLECLYRAFDCLALRRGVFKVETIGDCYMAVTGLPEPQEDHAVIMARFAQDCIVKMKEVTRKLELTLGPETTDLSLRVGFHSGPVTAGVLRGEKSRFQLFGDTVNTASRMESTGMRDTIQVSSETAQLLFAAGKSHWVKQREDAVYAKGKGEMTTFFLTMKSETVGSTAPSSVLKMTPLDKPVEITVHGCIESEREPLGNHLCTKSNTQEQSSVESQLWGYASLEVCRENESKHERLIDWNVEILFRLLKSVVAKRRLVSRRLNNPNRSPLTMDESLWKSKTSLLDEVMDCIVLPEFDCSTAGDYVDPDTIELSGQVVAQLRSYVSLIASMYKDVPFHNFEHASHVAMSANKLIQRIMAPDGIDWHHELKTKKKRREMISKERHDYTFGLTSDPLTQFAVVFSALIHDVDHPGVSNFQLIKENAPIAKLYKGKSVLEQNSIDLAWSTFMKPQFQELRRCIYTTEEDAKRFRQVIVNCVMATDIFDKELQNLRRQRWSKAFQMTARSLPLSRSEDNNRKATIVIEQILQASDIAHTMQHWHLYQKWNERLLDEILVAFHAERAAKHPMIGWYQGELGFFDNYVIPLANMLKDCGVFGVSGDEYLNYAEENRREWAVKGEEIVGLLVERHEDDSIFANETK